MFRKCCVSKCSSLRKDVKLHQLPSKKTKRNLWLQCINGNANQISKNMFVCHKHFEQRCVNPKTHCLKCDAYPTLFTDLEISSGKPSKVFEEPVSLKTCTDQTFTRKRHIDHSYSEPIESTPNKLAHPENNGKPPISANSSRAAENDNETIEEITVEDTQDCQEDDDVVLEDQTYGVTQSENDVTDQSEPNLHVGYKCNVCDSDIKGFRYVCVQCVDWDMCSGCEAKAAHSHHYVLRVPGPRPLNEIQPVLERIRRELMELSVFIEDSIKEENDLGDQMDPLQEEVNSIGVVNTLPDIEDEQMNSTLIFDNIDHFSSDDEVTNDTKQITTKISSVLPNTSNITKSESSGSSAMNITKSEGSAIFSVKCDLSVRPTTTCVANLQKSIFHTKKLSSKHFSSNLKVIDPKTFVRVERWDLKQKLSHIRSQSIKKK